jgi:hypothetical protein
VGENIVDGWWLVSWPGRQHVQWLKNQPNSINQAARASIFMHIYFQDGLVVRTFPSLAIPFSNLNPFSFLSQ